MATRKCVLTIVVGVLCLTISARSARGAEPTSAELLVNGDFQRVEGNKPTGWGLHPTNTKIEIKSEGDNKYICIESPDTNGLAHISQDVRSLNVPKGTVIRFTARYRTERITRSENAQFAAYSKFNYHQGTERTTLGLTLEPSADWKLVQEQFTLDRDVKDFQYLVEFNRIGGVLCIDELSVRIVRAQEEMVLFSLKKSAPTIDGQLNDPCWQGAQVANGFMPLNKIEPASAETEAMSCYDDKQLYFAVRAHEPDMKALKVEPDKIWRGDCVELFLNPDETSAGFTQIICDSEANVAVFRKLGSDGAEVKLPVKAKAQRQEKSWTIELAIPFEALRSAVPRDNQRWIFNVARERHAVSPAELASWSALGAFTQQERFGRLAFYSRHEVQAAMSYWRSSDRDPLMQRATVSGRDIMRQASGGKPRPTLWRSDPFSPNRKKDARWNVAGLTGGGETGFKELKHEFPEFYAAAMGMNRAIVAKAHADDALAQLRKALFYAGKPVDGGAISSLDARSMKIDEQLGKLFTAYGDAFDNDYNRGKVAALQPDIDAALANASALEAEALNRLPALGAGSESFAMLPAEKRITPGGASERLSITGMRFTGHEEIFSLFGPFDSINIDWPYAIAEMIAPNRYKHDVLDAQIRAVQRFGAAPRVSFQSVFGSQYWMPLAPWLEEKAASDPDVLLVSQDGLTPAKTTVAGKPVHQGVNPNNPHAIQFARDYLSNLARYAAESDKTHFIVTGWEDLNIIQVGEEMSARSIGYNPSNKSSLRKYLRERYGSIEKLNGKWKTTYANFDAIEPPDDKFLKPATKAGGLTYEFERWQRVNHVNYNALQYQSLKEGAPDLPVMIDDSNFLLEMNGYLLMKAGAADVISFHSNPSSERAMWSYLNGLSRRFGKRLGYHENYWEMYRANHLNDERLARRDVRKFFYDLYLNDIRLSSWWLRYSTSSTEYIVAYGGGLFSLDYDQTILRWSSAELAPMFRRGRAIERTLIDSQPRRPAIAVIQPCSTIFNLASMGKTYRDSTTLRQLIDIPNQMLWPESHAYELVPEEMVLDGKGSLDEYRVIVLPYAPYMNQQFAQRLQKWTEGGGTLVAVGPFALFDECGVDLPASNSVFKQLFLNPATKALGNWEALAGDAATAGVLVRPYKQGRVLYLNNSVDAVLRDKESRDVLSATLTEAARPSVYSDHPSLRIMVRDGVSGDSFLALCNVDIDKPIEVQVRLVGTVASATDVVVPGGFPMSVARDGRQSVLKVRLDPGDFTVARVRFAK